MRKYLLPQAGVDRKVNLHTHTTLSDGVFSPAEIKRFYKEKGYAAVAFTDHEIMIPHNDLSDGDFVALNGLEVSVKEQGGAAPCGAYIPVHHLCLIARDPENDLTPVYDYDYTYFGHMREHLDEIRTEGTYARGYDTAGLSALVAEADTKGFLSLYNHPRWSLQTPAGYVGVDGLCGVEVHNTGCVYIGDCNAEPLEWFLRAGKNPFPVAADDTHREYEMFGGWNMLRTEKLDYAALIAALENGEGYATEGPEIRDLYVENGAVTVTCSPAAKIMLLTEGRTFAARKAEAGGTIESATLAIPAKKPQYLRVEIVDAAGKKAWSRAFARTEWESEANGK